MIADKSFLINNVLKVSEKATFSNETLLLLQDGKYLTSILYIFGSIVCCLMVTYFGIYLSSKI